MIVFNDDDGVSPIHQTVQQLHDLLNIGSVPVGSWLVQHIDITLVDMVYKANFYQSQFYGNRKFQ